MGVTGYTTGESEKDNCRLELAESRELDFFKMLLDDDELTYAYVGCCMVE
jgi:hypothetical protein